jgi:hypothetical protein
VSSLKFGAWHKCDLHVVVPGTFTAPPGHLEAGLGRGPEGKSYCGNPYLEVRFASLCLLVLVFTLCTCNTFDRATRQKIYHLITSAPARRQ